VISVSTEQVASQQEAAVAVVIQRAALLHRISGGELLACFAAISDPRRRRGIRHRLATILGLCTAAVLAGQKTVTEITEWIMAADTAPCRAGSSLHGQPWLPTPREESPMPQ
jgi:DDE_Tnp_1-associated